MATLISRSGAQHARLAFPEVGFHNTGLYNEDGAYRADDHGIIKVTGDAADEGKFRTPSLRNIALTAPYMHDGSIAVAFLKSLTDKHFVTAPRFSDPFAAPGAHWDARK